jgi:hypothetical protein
VRRVGFTDGEIVEIITHVALNILTNTSHNAAGVEADFPQGRAVSNGISIWHGKPRFRPESGADARRPADQCSAGGIRVRWVSVFTLPV